MEYKRLSILIFVIIAVYAFAVSDAQAKKNATTNATQKPKPAKDNEEWECSDYTNVIENSLKRFLSDYKDDELKNEMQRLLEVIDEKKPKEKQETDEPGWETETESEKEIIVGTVKRGEKIKRGGANERVILKEKKPFKDGKDQSGWEITDEDERELIVRGNVNRKH